MITGRASTTAVGSIDSLLSKVSVVIPTFGQSSELMRTLEFVSSFPFKKVVVLDAIGKSANQQNLADSLPNVDFVVERSNLPSRMKLAGQYVESEFVLTWAHDEFWLPSAVAEGVSFLSSQPAYVHVVGACLRFRTPNIFSLVYPELPGIDIKGPSRNFRVEQRLKNYFWGGLWGLTRTHAWRNAWQVAASFDFAVRGSMEIQVETALAWQGGVRGLKSLMWLRAGDAPSITNSGERSLSELSPLFHSWWLEAPKQERQDFLFRFSSLPNFLPSSPSSIAKAFDSYSRRAEQIAAAQALKQMERGKYGIFLSSIASRTRRAGKTLVEIRGRLRVRGLRKSLSSTARCELQLAEKLIGRPEKI